LLLPQQKYFTVRVPFAPEDLDAATKAMACHKSQFTPELLQRLLPERNRIWNGVIAFVPASPTVRGNDLFGK
jgi:hypothetical protein